MEWIEDRAELQRRLFNDKVCPLDHTKYIFLGISMAK
jgi:hypothetical protein